VSGAADGGVSTAQVQLHRRVTLVVLEMFGSGQVDEKSLRSDWLAAATLLLSGHLGALEMGWDLVACRGL
jgi:hypothetical protein